MLNLLKLIYFIITLIFFYEINNVFNLTYFLRFNVKGIKVFIIMVNFYVILYK